MTHVTNAPNPHARNAKEDFLNYHCPPCEDKGKEWERHLVFVSCYIIGKPKSTKEHSQKYLISKGIVGLYKKNKNESNI